MDINGHVVATKFFYPGILQRNYWKITFSIPISRLAMREILIFELVCVAGQAGLNFTLSETPKTGSVVSRPL